jgi:PST family polysaccharide transporter
MKLLSLPLIFLWVKQADDISIYATITVTTTVLGGITAMLILWRKYRIQILWIPFRQLKVWYKDATAFFLTNSMNTIKLETSKVLIGVFFSMSDVALYDLAMKIYQILTTFIANINSALFPKVMNNLRMEVIRKILTIENLIGAVIVVFLIVFGRWIIVLLGSKAMLGAYPLLVILSFGVFVPLTAGAIMNFIFVPLNKYYLITKNQMVAIGVFLCSSAIGIVSEIGMIALPIAMTSGGFAEILLCYYYVIKMNKR